MVTFYHHKLISNAKFHLKKLLISFSRPLAHSISFFWSSKNFTPSLFVFIHQNIAFFLQKMKMLVVHQMALSFMLIKYDDKTLNSFRYISFYFLFHFVFFFFLSFSLFIHSRARSHTVYFGLFTINNTNVDFVLTIKQKLNKTHLLTSRLRHRCRRRVCTNTGPGRFAHCKTDNQQIQAKMSNAK